MGVAQGLPGQARGFGLAGCEGVPRVLLRLLLGPMAWLLAAVEWGFVHAFSRLR